MGIFFFGPIGIIPKGKIRQKILEYQESSEKFGANRVSPSAKRSLHVLE